MSRLLKVSAIAAMAVSAWALLLILAAVAYLLLTMALVSVGQAHDLYTPLMSPAGLRCCGGEDCEGVQEGDYTLNRNGSITIFSRRHQSKVTVDGSKITWLPLPPNDEGEVFPVHWCGRRQTGHPLTPGDQIDPSFWSYCVFAAPGGY